MRPIFPPLHAPAAVAPSLQLSPLAQLPLSLSPELAQATLEVHVLVYPVNVQEVLVVDSLPEAILVQCRQLAYQMSAQDIRQLRLQKFCVKAEPDSIPLLTQER